MQSANDVCISCTIEDSHIFNINYKSVATIMKKV